MFDLQFVTLKLELSCSYRCDKIQNNCCDEFGQTLECCLTLTCHLLNKSSSLAAALGVTKVITITTMNFLTLIVLLKANLDVQQNKSWGGFVEQMLVLSCTFKCDHIDNNQSQSGHTLLCCPSPTKLPLRSVCWTSKSNLRNTTKCDQNNIFYNYEFVNT